MGIHIRKCVWSGNTKKILYETEQEPSDKGQCLLSGGGLTLGTKVCFCHLVLEACVHESEQHETMRQPSICMLALAKFYYVNYNSLLVGLPHNPFILQSSLKHHSTFWS